MIERNIISSDTVVSLRNAGVGVAVYGNANPVIENNTVTGNSIGINIYNSNGSPSPTIVGNNFEQNSQYNIYSGQQGNYSSTAPDVNAANNWWGTTDLSVINQTIYDHKDNFNVGTVTFTPTLTSPNPEAAPNPNAPIPTPNPQATSQPSELHNHEHANVNLNPKQKWKPNAQPDRSFRCYRCPAGSDFRVDSSLSSFSGEGQKSRCREPEPYSGARQAFSAAPSIQTRARIRRGFLQHGFQLV